MTNRSIGHKIRYFRNQRGLSQLDLELAIETSYGRISKIETGKVNPTKETLIRIVEVLDLSIYDKAYLFGINIGNEILELARISKKLSTILDIKEICKIVTDELVSLINVSSSAMFIWNEKRQSLDAYQVTTKPSKAVELIQKFTGFNTKEVYFETNNPTYKESHYVRCLLENKVLHTTNLHDLTVPFIDKNKSKIIQNLIKMELALSIPLILEKRKLGVLGIVWAKDFVTYGEEVMIQTFADQISVPIYNAIRYKELKESFVDKTL